MAGMSFVPIAVEKVVALDPKSIPPSSSDEMERISLQRKTEAVSFMDDEVFRVLILQPTFQRLQLAEGFLFGNQAISNHRIEEIPLRCRVALGKECCGRGEETRRKSEKKQHDVEIEFSGLAFWKRAFGMEPFKF